MLLCCYWLIIFVAHFISCLFLFVVEWLKYITIKLISNYFFTICMYMYLIKNVAYMIVRLTSKNVSIHLAVRLNFVRKHFLGKCNINFSARLKILKNVNDGGRKWLSLLIPFYRCRNCLVYLTHYIFDTPTFTQGSTKMVLPFIKLVHYLL